MTNRIRAPRFRRLIQGFALSSWAFVAPFAVAAELPARDVGVVSHISVVSDKVQDVSSIEAWKASFIKPGMSEKEKAVAVWKSMVMFRQQSNPPTEYCGVEGMPLDPIKTFNVYGYNMCNGASAGIIQLSRHAGLEARGWGITSHSVPEVKIDGHWSMLDSSLINYFEKPDGSIAGVEEISKAIDDWLEKHPELRGDEKALTNFQRRNGWTGWKDGPELLSQNKFYDAGGFWPAGTHGWGGTMIEYGRPKKNFIYEYGAALGYQVNIQLRKGERLTRNWSNKGLHVDLADGKNNAIVKAIPGKEDLKYSPHWGDLAPGRVGNGTHEYDVPLADRSFRDGMLQVENLTNHRTDRADAAVLRVDGESKPGVLVIRMPSSYVYLGGELSLDAVVGGGSIGISLSDNNGLDWKPLTQITSSGKQKIDLSKRIGRLYDYRIKFELTGAGTGLNALKITNNIQHSQRALPALDQGDNKIGFRAGPQDGTVTIEGSTKPEFKAKTLFYTDYHPTVKNIATNFLRPAGGTGEVVFPIETPGDMTRIRIGAHYRARGPKDVWDISASFDGGKTFQSIGKLEGPYPGYSTTMALTQVPAGSRKALVKVVGTEKNTLVLFDLRIDADYKEPAGGFAPIKVTYTWTENGQERQDVHVAKSAEEEYVIKCTAKPTMKSIVMERAN
jgi:hypothetical protein